MARRLWSIVPLLLGLALSLPARLHAQAVRPSGEVRRLLLESSPANTERLCYLWRHFSTGGLTSQHVGEYVIAVPYGDNRYGCYIFTQSASGATAAFLARVADAVPMVNRAVGDAAVTRTGSWVTIADAGAYGGFYTRSLTAGDTIATTLTGHALFVRGVNISNAGFATVAIDGDYTAANRLPAVTQTEVDAGWFASGDLGKRYLDTYLASTDTDSVVCLAEGLTDTAHAITLRVQGSKRSASTDTRLYVTAFGAASALTKPTDASATFGFVRYVGDPRVGISSMAATMSFDPNAANAQFLGEGHGNDALVSESWYADGAAAAPAAGAFASGLEIRLERVFTLNHPSAAACATRRHVVIARAGDPAQLRSVNQVRWAAAGTINAFYLGMLPLSQLNPAGTPAYVQSGFDRLRLRDAVFALPALNDNGVSPSAARADYAAVFSTAHDTVVVCWLPRVDLAADGWSLGGGAFFQDRSDGMDKLYLRRLSNVLESVSPGTVHAWESDYRILRVPRAAARLSS